MPNLDAARALLQAELDQARKDLAYHGERVANLERALAQVASLPGPDPKGAATAKPKRPRRPKPAKLDASLPLPATASPADAISSAIPNHGNEPDKARRQRLLSRVSFAQDALARVKGNSGKSRGRRHFKS